VGTASGRQRFDVKDFPSATKTFKTKARAERWARAFENEMDDGVFVSRKEAESTTLTEAFERYLKEITPHKKGAIQETNRIKQFKKHPLAKRFLANIRSSDIAAYRDERLSLGKSSNTVKNELILISHLFNTARKEWGMESLLNPVANVRKPKLPPGRDRRLLEGEEDKLLDHAEYPTDQLIIIALETAMRQGEILGLRWEYIDIKKRVLTLPDTKNGESRDVPLSTFQNVGIRGRT
jgi:integrase